MFCDQATSEITIPTRHDDQGRTCVNRCVHTYLHRIGRSGRWGRKGVGINFVTSRDMRQLKNIEQHYHATINELTENWAAL